MVYRKQESGKNKSIERASPNQVLPRKLAPVVKLADTYASGAYDRKVVEVQILSGAQRTLNSNSKFKIQSSKLMSENFSFEKSSHP